MAFVLLGVEGRGRGSLKMVLGGENQKQEWETQAGTGKGSRGAKRRDAKGECIKLSPINVQCKLLGFPPRNLQYYWAVELNLSGGCAKRPSPPRYMWAKDRGCPWGSSHSK